MTNVTTDTQVDHSDEPIIFHIQRDPGETFPLHPHTTEYREGNYRLGILTYFSSNQTFNVAAVTQLWQIYVDHRSKMIRGVPQLNICDKAVMNWSPPGCKSLNNCLEAPLSNPIKCVWDH